MRIALICHDYRSNALGRVLAIWRALDHLGADTRTFAVERSAIWPGLADGDGLVDSMVEHADEIQDWADVFIAFKPIWGALPLAAGLAGHGAPIVLDIDDCDWEHAFGDHAEVLRRWAYWTRRGEVRLRPYLERVAARYADSVALSNPGLARWYDGLVVPHPLAPAPSAPRSMTGPRESSLEITFVGTPRPYKGLDVLRAAAAALEDCTLAITADPPSDARPDERWLGSACFGADARLRSANQVAVIPSTDATFSRGQLPMKLLNAMISATPVIASDLPPIRWAASDTALLVPPGDVDALVAALERLRDPALRRKLGDAARQRAMERFSVERVAPLLETAVESSIQRRHGPGGDARRRMLRALVGHPRR